MAGIKRHFSGAPWENDFGYCRALQVGEMIYISGTTAVVEGEIAHPNDAFKQTEVIFDKFEEVLAEFDCKLDQTVKVMLYLTNKKDVESVMQVYRKRLQSVCPTATLLIVDALIEPELCVEIQLEAHQDALPNA